MNNSEFVSRVLNAFNATNKDSRIPKRYVLHVGRQKSEFYISQKLNDKSLRNESNIYSVINCFELEKIDVVKCDIIEFRKCKSLMKSKKKLPKLIYSKYGSSLKEVTDVDGQNEFKPTTPSKYRRDKLRQEKSDFIEFYVKDGYLYLIDSEIEVVDLYFITTETDKLEECSSCKKDENCKSLWEHGFVTPDKMSEVVVQETIKEVSLQKQLPVDEFPNMNSNEK